MQGFFFCQEREIVKSLTQRKLRVWSGQLGHSGSFAFLMSFKIEPLFHWWNGCTFRCVESQHQFSAQCFTALVATTGKSLQVNPLKVTFPFDFGRARGDPCTDFVTVGKTEERVWLKRVVGQPTFAITWGFFGGKSCFVWVEFDCGGNEWVLWLGATLIIAFITPFTFDSILNRFLCKLRWCSAIFSTCLASLPILCDVSCEHSQHSSRCFGNTGPQPTRLETRTKESNVCASVLVSLQTIKSCFSFNKRTRNESKPQVGKVGVSWAFTCLDWPL